MPDQFLCPVMEFDYCPSYTMTHLFIYNGKPKNKKLTDFGDTLFFFSSSSKISI